METSEAVCPLCQQRSHRGKRYGTILIPSEDGTPLISFQTIKPSHWRGGSNTIQASNSSAEIVQGRRACGAKQVDPQALQTADRFPEKPERPVPPGILAPYETYLRIRFLDGARNVPVFQEVFA